MDLVLLATTHPVSAQDLHRALHHGYQQRGTSPPETIELPSPEWRAGYAETTRAQPHLAQQTAAQALQVVRAVLEPILDGRDHGTWNPEQLTWTP